MNNRMAALQCGVSLCALVLSAPALAQAAPAATGTTQVAANDVSASNGGSTLQEVVVTARRTNENLQKVPVAVTVISQQTFDVKGAFTPQDLSAEVPGLSVAAAIGDRNNVTYSIRGQGEAYGSLFPAVITYFNEVPITQFTTGQFFDLANVQVLRGPQGVLFGRVTDGGNILVGPKHPTNQFGGYVEGKVGDFGLREITGALNIPLISDKLLIRGAVDINHRDGFTTNIFNGEKLDGIAYESYRLGVTFRPFDRLENYTVVAYQHTHDTGTSTVFAGVNPTALDASTGGLFFLFPGAYGINGQGDVVPFQPGLTPLTSANYLASLQSRLTLQQNLGPRHVSLTGPSFDRRENLYVVNTTSFDLTRDIQLKNIFGYTNVRDDEASNFSGVNGETVLTCHSACGTGGGLPFNSQEQFSDELRLAGKSFDHRLSWSLGAYGDFQRPGEAFENDTINLGLLQRDSVQYTQTYEQAVFGFAEYDASNVLQGLKINGGVRYTHDRVSSSEATYLEPIAAPGTLAALEAILPFLGVPPAFVPFVANATVNSPVPHGLCQDFGAGGLFPATCNTFIADFHAVTYSVGGSYQFNSGQMVYAKISRGYRPGGLNGSAPPDQSPLYAPEFDTSVEIGLKGDWNFQGIHLRTNVAAYHDRYTNIQKSVVVPGAVPVTLIRNTAVGTIQGVEFEGILNPFRGLTIGLNYAYTDAQYDKSRPFDPSSCNPLALAVTGFCPFNLFAYTPKNQVGVSAHYELPVDERLGTITIGGKYYYQSKVALTDTSRLNPDAVEPGWGTLDLDATWQQANGGPVSATFFITNVTNRLYRTGADSLTQNSSVGTLANIYAPPRMFGFSLKYRFGS